MANSHVPYLQTLAKDEAIAFVSSLQKVKEHLSHELQWMNEQVQQKTIQLQGIDTLLAEAVGLGLVPLHTTTTKTLTAASDATNPSAVAAALSSVSQPVPSLADPAANGSNLVAQPPVSTDPTVSASESSSGAVPSTSTAPPRRGRQRQQNQPSQAKRDAALSATGKTSATKAKPGRPAQSASEASKAALSGFQKFLQVDFRDQSMTDAVGEILKGSTEPMNTDAIMSKLYEGLSGDSYQRAKSSLSNILSVGKSKGKWKSTGRGLYIGS